MILSWRKLQPQQQLHHYNQWVSSNRPWISIRYEIWCEKRITLISEKLVDQIFDTFKRTHTVNKCLIKSTALLVLFWGECYQIKASTIDNFLALTKQKLHSTFLISPNFLFSSVFLSLIWKKKNDFWFLAPFIIIMHSVLVTIWIDWIV